MIQEKVCDICGSVGFPESLVTCSLCNQASEHIYCMRNFFESIQEKWFCEPCQSQAGPSSMLVSSEKVTDNSIDSKGHNQPVDTSLPLTFVRMNRQWDIKRSPSHEEDPLVKSLPASSSSMESLPRGVAGTTRCIEIQPRKPDIREDSLLFPIFSGDKLVTDVLWKGSFQILLDIDCGNVYDGIRAHLPTKISPKAYEATKKMPQKLQLKLRPRHEIWPRIFSEHPPDADDVAVYFLPIEVNRTKYLDLLKRIEKHDLALQGCLDGAKMLIFASIQLPRSSQKLNGEIYLWGVLHGMRQNTFMCNEIQPMPSITSCDKGDLEKGHLLLLEDCTSSHVIFEDNSGVVNMEIDMVGGINIGRTDIVVPRVGPQFHPTEPKFNGLGKAETDILEMPPGFGPLNSKHSCGKSFQKVERNEPSGKRPNFLAESTNSLNGEDNKIAKKEGKTSKVDAEFLCHLKKDIRQPECIASDLLISKSPGKTPSQKFGTKELGAKKYPNFPAGSSNPRIVDNLKLPQKDRKLPVKNCQLQDSTPKALTLACPLREIKTSKVEAEVLLHLKKDTKRPENTASDLLTRRSPGKTSSQKFGRKELGAKKYPNFPAGSSNLRFVDDLKLLQKDRKLPLKNFPALDPQSESVLL